MPDIFGRFISMSTRSGFCWGNCASASSAVPKVLRQRTPASFSISFRRLSRDTSSSSTMDIVHGTVRAMPLVFPRAGRSAIIFNEDVPGEGPAEGVGAVLFVFTTSGP